MVLHNWYIYGRLFIPYLSNYDLPVLNEWAWHSLIKTYKVATSGLQSVPAKSMHYLYLFAIHIYEQHLGTLLQGVTICGVL